MNHTSISVELYIIDLLSVGNYRLVNFHHHLTKRPHRPAPRLHVCVVAMQSFDATYCIGKGPISYISLAHLSASPLCHCVSFCRDTRSLTWPRLPAPAPSYRRRRWRGRHDRVVQITAIVLHNHPHHVFRSYRDRGFAAG